VASSDDSDAGRRAVGLRPGFLVLAIALMVTACSGAAARMPRQTAAVPARAPQGEPIVIGGTLGLSGPDAVMAADIMAVYDLWAGDVNRGEGLLGRPVELRIYDDQGRPESARSLYQRLIMQDDADLLLAPDGGVIDAVLGLAEGYGMLLFNGGAASATVRSEWLVDAYTFTEPDHSRAVFEMVDALPDDRRPRRIGIVTARESSMLLVRDGRDGRGGVRRFARERGIEIVVDAEYPDASADLGALAERARNADVDLFFALAPVSDAVLLARAAAQAGFAPRIFCACGAPVAGLGAWDDLGAAGNGVVSTAMTWPSDDHPGIDTLTSHVRSGAVHDGLPVHVTGAYAILQVLQGAVEGAGRVDQDALRDHLAGNTVDTVVGPITFDRQRTPGYRAIVVQSLRDGDQVVWPPARATSQLRTPIGAG
jgi:branched-chain amino acid transport system substrate-binding protein